MSVQFEWQVGSDDGEWETIAKTERRRRRKWPWWAWVILAAIVVVVAASGYLILRHRYEELRRQIAFQIQSVIDLEARTFAEGDVDLFLAQQDEAASDWYTQQAVRVRTGCAGPQARCEPVLSARVQDVELHGSIAWVQVVEGQPLERKVRFYRETDKGWKHTAPRAQFWGPQVEMQYGNVVVYYHRRDQPYIAALLKPLAEASGDICPVVSCPAAIRLEVRFSIEAALDQKPRLKTEPIQQESDKLMLTSPWLSGIPADGKWDPSTVNEMVYWAAYGLAGKAIRSTINQNLNPLQQALLDEYAAWYSQQDVSQAPILERIVLQEGDKALPEVFRWVEDSSSLNALIVRWLGLSVTRQQVAYFQTLLDIEHDAILAGRKSTFLLLQDGSQQRWIEQQQELFDQAQLDRAAFSFPLVQVRDVELASQRATVSLAAPLVQSGGQNSDNQAPAAFFYLRGEDWKHTSPF